MNSEMDQVTDEILKEILRDEKNIEALREIVRNLPNIAKATSILSRLVETGALETISEILCMVNVSRELISSEMISGLGSLMSLLLELSARVNEPAFKELLDAILNHPNEIIYEMEKTQVKGLYSLLKQLRDKDTQKGLSIILAIMKVLGRNYKE
jgi:uncharacterized protein YjgD (DUF1641 family)